MRHAVASAGEKAYLTVVGMHFEMKLAALCSGGKDSSYAMMIMEEQGHEIPYLLSIFPADKQSMMFHTPNMEMVSYLAESMGKKLIAARAGGDEELTVLASLIREAVKLGAEGIVTGAIQSDFQFTRIDMLCHEAGVVCFSPLWRKDQGTLLKDMVYAGIRAVIVATAAEGLGQKHLGRLIDDSLIQELEELNRKKGVNQCGEGGEYETFTLDSPLHRESLSIADCSTSAGVSSSVLTILKIERKKKL